MSGGAPLNSEIAEFFQSAGILILEGYGLTETTGAVTVNTAQAFRFGTVGRPLRDVKLRIEEDGEILIKSQKVMPGYYKNEKATQDAFKEDGWFRSGDIGEIKDGYLRITDRKKDLLKTAGGKYIAPQKIELQLGLSPYITHSVIIADRRKYAVALIFPNIEELLKLPDFQEFRSYSPGVLVTDLKVRNFYREIVAETNRHLASFESIKNFDLVSASLTTEGGDLTPSLKIKRHAIAKRFAPEIEALYGIA
jgi:long-chain acyl-CoA synthetase